MRIFPFIYLIVYSLMHAYVIFKTRSSFNLKSRSTALLIIFSLIMITMPVFLRLSDSARLYLPTEKLFYIFFLWMGFIFLFCCLLLISDIYRSILRAWKYLTKKNIDHLILKSRNVFIVTFVLAILLVLYGLFEANNIKIERITLSTPKLPESTNKVRIVQISDVHIGPIIREKRLERIADIIKRLEPDILVATGDIVDGQINNHPHLIKPLQEIKTRYGKYAVAGNHEFYVGIGQSIDYLQKAGFIVLRGEAVTAAGLINIAGVDDPAIKYYSNSKITTEKEVLSRLSSDKFTILLKHRPYITADYIGLFDLQLSGHAHKGQIFPINLITMLYYDVHAGLAKLPNNSYLYVSRGAGTSGPPIRILSPPEIAVIDIIGKR